MVASPHGASRFTTCTEYMFRPASPLQWDHIIFAFFTFASVLLRFLLLYRRFRIMQSRSAAPFPFLDLPLELRTMVYNELLEDAYYPPPAPCAQQQSPLSWLIPGLLSPPTTPPQSKPSNWLFIANKQTYNEYMEIMCKKTTFHLTVSPQNYPGSPVTPTVEPTVEANISEEKPLSTPQNSPGHVTHTVEANASEEKPAEPKRLWNIAPETLNHLHKCDLELITTSAMLGVADPSKMKPGEWALATQIRDELKEVSNVGELNLTVKAIADRMWNPLWVWYHSSQALKTMGTATESGPTGPKLNRITFSLDGWSPGENRLERDASHGNQWMWKCPEQGHCVAADGPGEVTSREFCSRLYMNCHTCRPELLDDEE